MKQVHLWITDEQAKELNEYPNKTEVIRNAIDLYNQHITPDTLRGLRYSYTVLIKQIDERFTRQDEKFERMDKLLSYLESQM